MSQDLSQIPSPCKISTYLTNHTYVVILYNNTSEYVKSFKIYKQLCMYVFTIGPSHYCFLHYTIQIILSWKKYIRYYSAKLCTSLTYFCRVNQNDVDIHIILSHQNLSTYSSLNLFLSSDLFLLFFLFYQSVIFGAYITYFKKQWVIISIRGKVYIRCQKLSLCLFIRKLYITSYTSCRVVVTNISITYGRF